MTLKQRHIPVFWQAILACLGAYLLFDNVFVMLNWLTGEQYPALMPRSLMVIYMFIVVITVLLYCAADDDRWREFHKPLRSLLLDKHTLLGRWVVLLMLSLAGAMFSYQQLIPSDQPPPQLRQSHPAPPDRIRLYGKSFNLSMQQNPLRQNILDTVATDPEAGWKKYDDAVSSGRRVYFKNCFYCHGALLDGNGHFSKGMNPPPVNFLDKTILPQLQESYLFWRIATGGSGLPREGTPWDSTMPAWKDRLSETEIWQLLLFMFDYSGLVPSIWDAQQSKAVSAMQQQVRASRETLMGKPLYDQYCADCHGAQGAGDGFAADLMYPKPRDFSLALFKYKTSPGTQLPRDQDLFNAIKFGLTGTAMPGWKSLITDKQIESLIPLIKSFDLTAAWAPDEADDEAFDDDGFYLLDDHRVITEQEPLGNRPAYDRASIEQGRRAYMIACKECHGAAARGDITSGKRLEDDWGNRIWPRDLTQPGNYRMNYPSESVGTRKQAEIESIYQRISIGMPGTPMPAHRALETGNDDPLEQEDRWHIAHYIYRLGQESQSPGQSSIIAGHFLDEPLPDEPLDPRWKRAPPVMLNLVPNVIEGDRLFTPLNRTVVVRALFNERKIAFLLELNDRTESRPGIEYFTQLQDQTLKMYADAIAIQLPDKREVNAPGKPFISHGEQKQPTALWYWNAGSVAPDQVEQVGMLQGKGLGRKLIAQQSPTGLQAKGVWNEGRWQILMSLSRDVTQKSHPLSVVNEFFPIAFANWDGSNGETRSRHTFTPWVWMHLSQPQTALKRYGIPVLVFLSLLLLGGLLFRHLSNDA